MSWTGGWLGGPSEGDPLYLEECETINSFEDAARVSQESFEEVLELEKSSEWKEIQFSDPRIYLAELHQPDSLLKIIKLSTILDGSPKQVKEFFSIDDLETRKKWDTELIELKVVEKHGDVEIVFQSYEVPFPVTNRSFVATREARTLPDGTIISFGKSVNHDKCPFSSKYVRGTALSGLFYKPVPGEPFKTQLIRMVKIDPKGNIPTKVVNMGISKAGQSLQKVIEVVHEESKKWDRSEESSPSPVAAPVAVPVEPRLLEDDSPQFGDADDETSEEELRFYETSSVLDGSFMALEELVRPLHESFKEIENKTESSAQTTQTTLQALTQQQEKLQRTLAQLEKQQKLFLSRSKPSSTISTSTVLLLAWPVVVVGVYDLYKRYYKK